MPVPGLVPRYLKTAKRGMRFFYVYQFMMGWHRPLYAGRLVFSGSTNLSQPVAQ